MPGYRYAPSMKAVFVGRQSQARDALRMQEIARRDGVVVRVISARGGAATEQPRIARVYFGRVLTATERKSLKKAGFSFAIGSYCGLYGRIPGWVWDLRRVDESKRKPRVAPDLTWEPGKKP